jgi:hypothetical protein
LRKVGRRRGRDPRVARGLTRRLAWNLL